MSDTRLAELAALQTAYNTGANYIRYEDRMVRYPSGEDMLARILILKRELGLSGPTSPSIVSVAGFTR